MPKGRYTWIPNGKGVSNIKGPQFVLGT